MEHPVTFHYGSLCIHQLLRLVQWILCWKKSWVQKCCSKIMIIMYPFIMDHPVPFHCGSLSNLQLLRLDQWVLCWNNCWVQKRCSKNNDHPVSFHYGSPCTLSLWNTLYHLLVQVGPMSYYLKLDHPVPFHYGSLCNLHYGSPCTLSLWITVYPFIMEYSVSFTFSGCSNELLFKIISKLWVQI